MMSDRQTLIRSIHAAAKAAGLDDNTYRDRLERVTGSRTCSTLDDAQLKDALKDFRKAGPRLHPHGQKAKAIWIGLYNLGVVEGTDAALDAFAQRQTGAAKLSFVGALDARKLTEALKAMATREGWEIPSDDEDGMEARRHLIFAQWKKLAKLGAVRIALAPALENWCHNQNVVPGATPLRLLKRHQLDLAARKLGDWLRKTIRKTSAVAGVSAGESAQ